MTKKRYRVPEPKPGVLEAVYGREERFANPSVVYVHGGHGSERADARILSELMEGRCWETGRMLFGSSDRQKSFVAELERRGYDITTLKFSIKRKAP